MVKTPKPWRTSMEVDTYVDSAEEIQQRLKAKVAGMLGSSATDVKLLFCGMDGDEISKNNLPFLKGSTVFARGLEDVAGEKVTIDPIDYAEEYTHPALVVYDGSKLHSPMDDGEYDHSDDAVLGVIFLDNDGK